VDYVFDTTISGSNTHKVCIFFRLSLYPAFSPSSFS
jgi:hypothetical protein